MARRTLLRGGIVAGGTAAIAISASIMFADIGCSQKSEWPQNEGEVVPAGEPENIPGMGIAARYWGEMDAKNGRIALYRIYPGNVIYRNEHQEAVNYNYNYDAGNVTIDGTCTPSNNCIPSGQAVHGYTDQNQVTFVDSNGQCTSNGTIGGNGCLTIQPPCTTPGTFCAPVQLTSNVTFGATIGGMPDVVLQIANAANAPNPVTGCVDDTRSGNVGRQGLCKYNGAAKVDATSSNLTSIITGNGTTSFGCSWCYGNAFKLANNSNYTSKSGLKNVMVSGLDSTLEDIYTDTLAMDLTNNSNTTIVITVRYSIPTLDVSNGRACGTINGMVVPGIVMTNGSTNVCKYQVGMTKITATGGAFGPPNSCLAQTPPTSCTTAAGAPRVDYQISMNGIPLAPPAGQTSVLWSDTQIQGLVGGGTAGTVPVTISTPVGPAAISGNIPCSTCAATVRPLSSTITAIGSAAGLFGSTIVVAGGRSNATKANTDLSNTYLFSLPTSSTNGGSVSSGPALNTSRWGAAYTMANGALWVIGGTHTSGHTTSCTTSVEKLTSTSGPWQTVTSAALPVGLCQAAAFTSGNLIVLAGGSTTPFANSHDTVTSNGNKVYVLDTSQANPSWTLASSQDTKDRFNQASVSVSNGSGLILGGSNFSKTVLGDVSNDTIVSGSPQFAATTALNPAVSLPAAVEADGIIFVIGGGTAADGGTAGTTGIYMTVNDLSDPNWYTAPTGFTAIAARAAHVAVAAQPSWSDQTLVYIIGGANNGSAVTEIDEYTP